MVVDLADLERMGFVGDFLPFSVYVIPKQVRPAVPVDYSVWVGHWHHHNPILFPESPHDYFKKLISGLSLYSLLMTPSATKELEVSEGCCRAITTIDF